MTDLNKERELCNQSFEKYWDDFCEAYGNGFDRSLAKLFFANGWGEAKAQAVPDTKPIAYKVSFDSWQRQHGKDYFEFWKPDEFEDYKPDYLIPLYSFPTISSDFVVVPKEPTQKMLNAAHCYMNPVKGSDVHPETNRKRREMYKAMVKASESGAEG